MATPIHEIINLPVDADQYTYLENEITMLVDNCYTFSSKSNNIDDYLISKHHKNESTKLSEFKLTNMFQLLLTLFTAGLCKVYNVSNMYK